MIALIFTHFIADFVFQSRKMGKLKSSHWGYLSAHLLIQFLCFIPLLGIHLSLANALIHGVIDKNIWNGYKLFVSHYYKLNEETSKTFKYWEDHYFFVTIGLDQALHMTTLYLLFTLL